MPSHHEITDVEKIRSALVAEIVHRLYIESLPRILQCLERLNEDQIWWRPNPASNSIGNLVLHLSGNVRQWIYAGLGGHDDHRQRQAEFDRQEGHDREELMHMLTQTMELVRPVIERVSSPDLLRKRPVQTFEETGMTILIHVTEHFSYHTGQIAYITKLLTERDLGFYADIPLE